jgi:hypothetical protein
MSKFLKVSGLNIAAVAIVGLMSGVSSTALANEGASAAQDMASERVTRAPHKVANQFHRRHVIKETAEFARLEIAPEAAAGNQNRGPLKSGNRFHRPN